MPSPTIEERYDEEIAQQMLQDGHKWGGGLPQFLGIELVRFEPGKLWCRATVGDELLTPLGNLHGGVVAAIIDHVTGVVVYPLMPPATGPPPPRSRPTTSRRSGRRARDRVDRARHDQPQRGGAR